MTLRGAFSGSRVLLKLEKKRYYGAQASPALRDRADAERG